MDESRPLVPRESEQDCTAIKPPNPCLSLLWDGPGQVLTQGWLRNSSLDSGQEGSHWGHQGHPLSLSSGSLAECLTHWSLLRVVSWEKKLPIGVNGSGPHPQPPPGFSLVGKEGTHSTRLVKESTHPQRGLSDLPAGAAQPLTCAQVELAGDSGDKTLSLCCRRLSRFSPLRCALSLF